MLLLSGPTARAQQQRMATPVQSSFDPRLAPLRVASEPWKAGLESQRTVLDQVCLVPDEATFYEALQSWTDSHYFPILIDDVNYTLKFLQAFRPARIVRFPRRAAVADRWQSAEKAANSPGKFTAPGLVIARKDSPTLPGLAALARGHSQRLASITTEKDFTHTLSPDELLVFLNEVDAKVKQFLPRYDQLGDSCDFLTLAGDLPYRYQGAKGPMAIDDKVGRARTDDERWAFSGRIMGDARQSVYIAMCSLFLRPSNALAFNSYPDESLPWSAYSLQPAANHLRLTLPTKQQVGSPGGSIQGWHSAFDPENRFGLIFINTKGSPRIFDLLGGSAHAYDVMPSVPTAVCIIHSFSAAEPWNTETIAGRWLAQGAFLYHGSMDEPFLNSFRFPALTAELLQSGIPFSAALRPLRNEPFGEPWKLVLLGDPLYTLQSSLRAPSRSTDFGATASWVKYQRTPLDRVADNDSAKLGWALATTLANFASDAPKSQDSILPTLLAIKRANLAPAARAVLNSLLLEVAYREQKLSQVKLSYVGIPANERTPAHDRLALAAHLVSYSRAYAEQRFDAAASAWGDLVRIGKDAEFKRMITQRTGNLADATKSIVTWTSTLKRARPAARDIETVSVIDAELDRLAQQAR